MGCKPLSHLEVDHSFDAEMPGNILNWKHLFLIPLWAEGQTIYIWFLNNLMEQYFKCFTS